MRAVGVAVDDLGLQAEEAGAIADRDDLRPRVCKIAQSFIQHHAVKRLAAVGVMHQPSRLLPKIRGILHLDCEFDKADDRQGDNDGSE